MPTFGPTLAADNIIQIVSHTFTQQQSGVNVFHYRVTTAATGVANFLSDFMASFAASNFPMNMKALISSQATYKGFLCRIIQPTLSLEYGNVTGFGPGVVLGDMFPKQVAGLLRKRPAVPGRRMGGRLYVPFPGEVDNAADSTPTITYQGKLLDLAITLISQVLWGTGGSAKGVIYKRPKPTIPPTPYATRDISEWQEMPGWATQRRRGTFGPTNTSPL